MYNVNGPLPPASSVEVIVSVLSVCLSRENTHHDLKAPARQSFYVYDNKDQVQFLKFSRHVLVIALVNMMSM